jgi:hypothetical protein
VVRDRNALRLRIRPRRRSAHDRSSAARRSDAAQPSAGATREQARVISFATLSLCHEPTAPRDSLFVPSGPVRRVADALVSTRGPGAYDGSLTKRGTGTCIPRTDRAGPGPRGSSGTCSHRRQARRWSSAGDLRPPQPRWRISVGSRSTARPASALEINRPEPSTDRCQQTLGPRSGRAVGSGSGRG